AQISALKVPQDRSIRLEPMRERTAGCVVYVYDARHVGVGEAGALVAEHGIGAAIGRPGGVRYTGCAALAVERREGRLQGGAAGGRGGGARGATGPPYRAGKHAYYEHDGGDRAAEPNEALARSQRARKRRGRPRRQVCGARPKVCNHRLEARGLWVAE